MNGKRSKFSRRNSRNAGLWRRWNMMLRSIPRTGYCGNAAACISAEAKLLRMNSAIAITSSSVAVSPGCHSASA